MTRPTESAASATILGDGVTGPASRSASVVQRYRRVERRHVDLLRVASSLCRSVR